MITRIILGLITAVSFFFFFSFGSYKFVRAERVLVVEAKASYAQNGRLTGAFLVYRELNDSMAVGEPLVIYVDDKQYDKAELGDYKIEYVRNQLAYVLFVIGIASMFMLVLSINPFVLDMINSLKRNKVS